jgi:hypothetical protein
MNKYGVEWEEQGPYCELCNAHMGVYYNAIGVITPDQIGKWPTCFINPHGYEPYSENTCPECGQEYKYEEGLILKLSEEQLQALRDLH